MTGVHIDGAALKRLCRGRRLTGDAMSVLIKRSRRQVYRLYTGEPTSFEVLDRMVPHFGSDTVAGLIADPEQREDFLAAHRKQAE